MEFDFFSFRQYRYCDRWSVYAALRFRGRNTLYAVDSTFILELAIYVLACNFKGDFFIAPKTNFIGVKDFDFPAFYFCIAHIGFK